MSNLNFRKITLAPEGGQGEMKGNRKGGRKAKAIIRDLGKN